MIRLLAILFGASLLSCGVLSAYADSYTETRKKDEERKAVQFQKEILHFDYSKILKKSKGFKAPIFTEPKQKSKMWHVEKLKL